MKKILLNILVCCLGLGFGFMLFYSLGVFPPPARTGHQAPVITIAGDGSLSMAGKQMDLNQLSANLKQKNKTTPGFAVTILADTNTDSNRVQEVVDTCKAAGVTKISLRTSAKP